MSNFISNSQKLPWTFAAPAFETPGWHHSKIIRLCRHAGFSGIEGNTAFCKDKSDLDLSRIRTAFRAADLKIETFHLPFELDDDPASFYDTIRSTAIARHILYMEKAKKLGCSVAILHATTKRYSVKIEGFDKFFAQLRKSLQILIPQAKKLGLKIALENLMPGVDGNRFASLPEHFIRFRQEFNDSALGFCLDTGHARVACETKGIDAFFDAMGKKLIAFHLQDNAGDRDSHLAPGHGLVDWPSVFKRMRRLGFARAACIEAPPFAYGPHHTHAFASWKKMVEQTTKLALCKN